MYYPYFRAKQYELKAVREFAAENINQKSIVPIFEPVNQQVNALNLAIDDMLFNRLKFALVLNPMDGDFKHTTILFNKKDLNSKLWETRGDWIPAFLYSKNNAELILKEIQDNHLCNAMIIFKTCMDIDDKNIWELINNQSVQYIVNAFGSTNPRRLRSKLKETAKQIIRLDDCFISKIRNADYAQEVDELFSEEPFFFAEDWNLDGYSDYTTLPKNYVEGGMMPYALAIHLTYKKNEDQLYIHHFVSDSNKTNRDIRGKFREAAIKIAPFFEGKHKTKAVEELISKADLPDGYPGLGYIKKLSIKNHLELILSL